MKHFRNYLIGALIAALLVTSGCAGKSTSKGERFYNEAKAQYEKAYFTEAAKLYKKARPLLIDEGREKEAADCRYALQVIELYGMEFPYSESEIKKMLAEEFPEVPEEQREEWINEKKGERMEIDGKTRYFYQMIGNIKYRNKELFDTESLDLYKLMFSTLEEEIASSNPVGWESFVNPQTYRGNGTLSVPRDKLPETGLLKLWFPLPIIEGPQSSVTVDSIVPDTYVKFPPSIDQDIGLVYMEVPLEELEDDLDVNIQFTFTHYEQRFKIDPEKVGEYNRKDPMYKKYTSSHGNTAINPEIKEKARSVVGDEKNPYLAAKMLYEYVIEEIVYSPPPIEVLWPTGNPSSVYVHENSCGDCGTQGSYFVALCRSMGIPARNSGGWQLFAGGFNGHFWAEFYLPNYGWLPVDPTAATISDYVPDISEERRKRFKDFFFGNLDNYRCIIQTDLDLPLIPPASNMVPYPVAVQKPFAACDTMDEMPFLVINEHWRLEEQKITSP